MRYVGKILYYYSSRGFGWLEAPDKSNTYYHISEVPGRKSLDPGTAVSFELATDDKGRVRAVKIEILPAAQPQSASGQNAGSNAA